MQYNNSLDSRTYETLISNSIYPWLFRPLQKLGPIHHVDAEYETATFGMGCFWSGESLFGATPGVLRTKVGYSGGKKPSPKYKEIGDHVECITLDYDPKKVSYKQLLHLFWNNHEYGLTTRVKRQYMSLILYHNDTQKEIAEESIKEERVNRAPEVIITELAQAQTFYPAEEWVLPSLGSGVMHIPICSIITF